LVALSRRQKAVLTALLLYWPAIFIGTHIPQIPQWVGQIVVSDKVMHFVAYLLLSFLLWFAVNPDKKVRWRKPAVWFILFVVVWYGVIDEWLQMYVGRNADVHDFFADLTGAVTGLAILTFVNFWPASLVITGGGIFAMTNFLRAHPVPDGLRIDLLFCVCAYGFFTLLWLRFIHHFLMVKAPQGRWLLGAAALPIGLMLTVELFCAIAGYGFSAVWLLLAVAAISAVAAPFFIYGLLRNKAQVQAAPYA
jgi:VanZ family protein